MKVTVIYGNARQESTYNCVRIIKERLQSRGEVHFTEYVLPKDLPQFCAGCFACFYKGEAFCPHQPYVEPIAKALDEADGVILSSPAYVLSVSGQMKSLLDHLAYRWLPHRPSPAMFGKAGFAVSTTAGVGAGSAVKVMKNSLDFWGVRRVFTSARAVGAKAWDEVKPKTRAAIEKELSRKADRFYDACLKSGRKSARLKTRFMFLMLRKMQLGNNYNLTDRAHWERNGWLDGKKPF